MGWTENPSIDNAFLYGKWVPQPSDFLAAFLHKFEASESGDIDEDVWVSIDSPDDIVGTIQQMPEDEVEIVMRRPPSKCEQ
jgi:hypothetical protein